MPEPVVDVAVVGGGWAGCAAALELAGRGCRVTLLEAAATLGGRARRVVRDGLSIDNGAHLLLGAYRETLRLVDRLHAADAPAVLARRPLALVPPATGGDAVAIVAPALPAPFGVIAAIARARGLSASDRAGVAAWFAGLAARGFRRPPGETVAQMLARVPPRAAAGLWEPLCLAALNTPPAQACAQTFANVLRAAFARRARDADLVLPAADLSAIFPDAAASRLVALGSSVRTRSPARVLAADARAVTLQEPDGTRGYAGVVIATGPHQLARAVAPALRADCPALDDALRAVEGLAYEPIATVWLGFRARAPVPAPLLRLDDAPGQWAFERSDVLARATAEATRLGLAQLFAVVSSGHGDHDRVAPEVLAADVESQLRRLLPGLAPAAWRQVIRERRATYACTPARPRIAAPAVHPRVVLAGDHLDPELPATLEAAVRAGLAAARILDAALRGAAARDRRR